MSIITTEEVMQSLLNDTEARATIKRLVTALGGVRDFSDNVRAEVDAVRTLPLPILYYMLSYCNNMSPHYPLGYNNSRTLVDLANWLVANGYSSHCALEQCMALIPDKDLPDFAAATTLANERTTRNKAKFNAAAKSLALDLFSYKVFENYIKSLPKKLTGRDAVRYIDKLPTKTTNEEKAIHSKYLKLLWDNVSTKSVELSDAIMYSRNHIIQDSEQAFKVVHNVTTDFVGTPATQVHFTYYYFVDLANTLGKPIRINSACILESSVYKYITGVHRKSSMSLSDVAFALDKIELLSYQIQNNPTGAPYYQMALDQLVEELKRPDNISNLNLRQVKAGLDTSKALHDTLSQILKASNE